MNRKEMLELLNKQGYVFKPHPWHGVELWADKNKRVLNVFVEMVPDDTVKYELDKKTGYLKIDRPQKFSNIMPALYGFVPQTYCDNETAQYSREATGRMQLQGDHDPLDICVLTEKRIPHGNLLVEAVPIGGFRMIDKGEVDDKIIAVLKDDAVYGKLTDIDDCPELVISRLKHYFLTYKQIPQADIDPIAEITDIYGATQALEVIKRSEADYQKSFGL